MTKPSLLKYIYLGITFCFVSIIALPVFYYIDFRMYKIRLPVEQFEISRRYPQDLSEEEKEELSKINYEVISLNKIPQNCIDAIVSIEDKSFFTNNGIDKNGLARLFLNAIPGSNTIGGGSTISQQVIKMATNRFYSRNPLDKLKEIIWAYRLNKSQSKDEVLERYLNNVYMGEYNYGVSVASKAYFNKNIEDLSLVECAYLMGIPQIPNLYIPKDGIFPVEGKKRQVNVLYQMVLEGYISSEEYESALNQPL